MNDCGSAAASYLYFIVVYIASSYVMINLFVAVLLDSFAFIANVQG